MNNFTTKEQNYINMVKFLAKHKDFVKLDKNGYNIHIYNLSANLRKKFNISKNTKIDLCISKDFSTYSLILTKSSCYCNCAECKITPIKIKISLADCIGMSYNRFKKELPHYSMPYAYEQRLSKIILNYEDNLREQMMSEFLKDHGISLDV